MKPYLVAATLGLLLGTQAHAQANDLMVSVGVFGDSNEIKYKTLSTKLSGSGVAVDLSYRGLQFSKDFDFSQNRDRERLAYTFSRNPTDPGDVIFSTFSLIHEKSKNDAEPIQTESYRLNWLVFTAIRDEYNFNFGTTPGNHEKTYKVTRFGISVAEPLTELMRGVMANRATLEELNAGKGQKNGMPQGAGNTFMPLPILEVTSNKGEMTFQNGQTESVGNSTFRGGLGFVYVRKSLWLMALATREIEEHESAISNTTELMAQNKVRLSAFYWW